MPARIDPFVDVLLRERGDQLYLLPDEPVTMVKDGKPRKVSRQPLTDQHIYALLVEVAPSESADHIDQMAETEFEYIADRGMVRVRIVPEAGRLTPCSRRWRIPGRPRRRRLPPRRASGRPHRLRRRGPAPPRRRVPAGLPERGRRHPPPPRRPHNPSPRRRPACPWTSRPASTRR